MPDVFAAILLIGGITYLIYRAARAINGDARADAWQRNHAHRKRWYE